MKTLVVYGRKGSENNLSYSYDGQEICIPSLFERKSHIKKYFKEMNHDGIEIRKYLITIEEV